MRWGWVLVGVEWGEDGVDLEGWGGVVGGALERDRYCAAMGFGFGL